MASSLEHINSKTILSDDKKLELAGIQNYETDEHIGRNAVSFAETVLKFSLGLSNNNDDVISLCMAIYITLNEEKRYDLLQIMHSRISFERLSPYSVSRRIIMIIVILSELVNWLGIGYMRYYEQLISPMLVKYMYNLVTENLSNRSHLLNDRQNPYIKLS